MQIFNKVVRKAHRPERMVVFLEGYKYQTGSGSGRFFLCTLAQLNFNYFSLLKRSEVRKDKPLETAGAAIRKERDRLNRFLMQAPAGICILRGPKLIFELVNPVYQALLPGRKLLNRPVFEALPELIGSSLEEILLNVYNTGKSYKLDELLVPVAEFEGGPTQNRYFSFNYDARRNEYEEIDGVMAFVYEVTEQVIARQKAEANERHFRHLADLVPAKISNALPSGEVTFLNKQWLDYSGLTFEELRDFGYHNMMHPDEIESFQIGLAEAAATGRPYESEIRVRNAEGKYRWHLNIASPILDDKGQITMWVGSTTDIQKIKDEEQRKSDFIGMVSHELKTPLTSINGYLQLLQAKAKKAGDSFERNAIDQAVKQTRKMTVMIKGFLNVSRFESSEIPIKKQPFEVAELLKEINEELKLLYTTHHLEFAPCEPMTVLADRDKIGHVVINLVSNACKYSKTGSAIKVNCRINDDNVILSVSDEGVGIKKEDFNCIFDRYYRVENNSTVSGFGIGLYLCTEIIKRHEGKIWVESELGKGSTFYFSLPIAKCA